MTKKFSFVNIIFFVVFGVLTGVLWAYLCPIPLIPGAVHFRTFAFIIVVIGYLFGPVTCLLYTSGGALHQAEPDDIRPEQNRHAERTSAQ